VFSDFDKFPDQSLLEDAYLDINLAAYFVNYENLTSDEYIRLYLIVAESQNKKNDIVGSVQQIQDALDDNIETLNKDDLTIGYLLKPFI
jgi:hypothetical protein